MSHSKLVNLPNELLHDIFDYITVSEDSKVISITILRATCWRFRSFLDDPLATMGPAGKSVMQQRYSYFLRSRLLDALIGSEMEDRFVCIACMRLLPAKLFFSTPADVPSHPRLCKGHEGELNFFGHEHENMTWEKLHAGGLQYWNPVRDFSLPSVPVPYRNNGADWYNSLPGGERRELGPTEKAQKGVFLGPADVHDRYYGHLKDKRLAIGPSDFLLRREWGLCESSHKGDKTAHTIESRVDSVLSRVTYRSEIESINLCPHIDGRTVASGTTVHKLLQSKTFDCPMQSCKTRLWIERQTIKFKLEAESAKSQRKLFKGTSDQTEEWLVLVVVRNVGSMTDPTDPQWIAQLDAPRWPRFDITIGNHYCPPLWLTAQSGHPG